MLGRLGLIVAVAVLGLSPGLATPAIAGEGCAASRAEAAAVTAESGADASHEAAACAHSCGHYKAAAQGVEVACACLGQGESTESADVAEVAQTDEPKD